MGISTDQVRYIARLARLRLDDDEVEQYGETLSRILDYVSKLEELDTSDVEPTTHAIPLVARTREDEVEERLTQEEVLQNAPATVDDQFRVPKVVED